MLCTFTNNTVCYKNPVQYLMSPLPLKKLISYQIKSYSQNNIISLTPSKRLLTYAYYLTWYSYTCTITLNPLAGQQQQSINMVEERVVKVEINNSNSNILSTYTTL